MKLHRSVASPYVPALLAILLPVILVYSSVRTFHELDQMKSVFLRNRSAAIAARLETLKATSDEELRVFGESEPGLIRVRVMTSPGDPTLADLWNGRELFRTEEVRENSIRIFRSFIPFHGDGQLRIAQIDLDAATADFLLVHARHNVLIATVSSGVIVVLAAYALWSLRRAAAEEKHDLELTHLAHLGKMSAVLAHEIRTPLATIKGFTQLALEQADRSVRTMLEPVIDEAQRLERLVSDLLLYGRPPAPAFRDCSWDEIASSLAAFNGCVTVEPATLRFRTDPDLLRHVLGNLVRNSVEAANAGGETKVNVAASLTPDEVVVAVEDNGPGIPEGTMDKVFESFYTTKSFGTGLGLPIARSLTAALGGQLLLRVRKGGGTRAEVHLPAAGAYSVTEV
jgi:two-component system sensor histidine kinase HydH